MIKLLFMIWASAFLMLAFAIPFAWMSFRLSSLLSSRLETVIDRIAYPSAIPMIVGFVISFFFVLPAVLFSAWAIMELLFYIGFPL